MRKEYVKHAKPDGMNIMLSSLRINNAETSHVVRLIGCIPFVDLIHFSGLADAYLLCSCCGRLYVRPSTPKFSPFSLRTTVNSNSLGLLW
jgi:hypothetical protein